MDLNPVVGNVMGVASIVVVPIAGLLVNKALSLAKLKFGIQVSAADEAVIGNAVAAGAGMLRAKLASGEMTLSDVNVLSPHVDHAARAALDVAGAAGVTKDVTMYQLSARIVGMVGHALGEDPAVPSVAPPVKSAVSAVAAMGLLALVLVGGLAACTAQQDVTAAQGLMAANPCVTAIQAKVASEPTASDAQKALDADTVATTNTSCLALATDAATLVQQALDPTASATTTPATATTGASP